MSRLAPLLVASSLVGLLLAGCADSDSRDGSRLPGGGASPPAYTQVGVGDLQVSYAPGALTRLNNTGAQAIAVGLPAGTLVLQDGRWSPAESIDVAAGKGAVILPSPGASSLRISAGKGAANLGAPASDEAALLSGRRVVEWLHVQNDTFPHRTPGMPNYGPGLAWAGGLLSSWGYEVEVDPYGTVDVPYPTELCPPVPVSGRRACPSAVANVVATKPGTDPLGSIIVVGGHYDVVPNIVHGAYDNTAGALSVMALAEALAPYEFEDTLVFGLWGGEESGLLGSAFWFATHPHLRPRISAYWNFDTVGLSWPAAPGVSHPVTVSYAPHADEASAGGFPTAPNPWLESIRGQWMQFPEEYDGKAAFRFFADNTVTSDSLVFSAAGVPTFIPHTCEYVCGTFLHKETDTLENLTKFALHGEAADYETPGFADAAERLEGERRLAASFDPYLWLAFYHIVLADNGMFDVAVPAP